MIRRFSDEELNEIRVAVDAADLSELLRGIEVGDVTVRFEFEDVECSAEPKCDPRWLMTEGDLN